jgi:bacterioferritin
VRVGETVPEQFEVDLQLEYTAIARLNAGIATCVSVGDNATRALLEGILVSEEEHADWLEGQIELIRQIGDAHYLAQQIRD